jgi:transposase-like protein
MVGGGNVAAPVTVTVGYGRLGVREEAIREQRGRAKTAEIRRHLLLTGGNVALTAHQLDVNVNRVREVKDEFGIEHDPELGPAVHGDRRAEQAAVRAVFESGGSVKRAVRETGVPESTVREWRNRWGYPSSGAAA